MGTYRRKESVQAVQYDGTDASIEAINAAFRPERPLVQRHFGWQGQDTGTLIRVDDLHEDYPVLIEQGDWVVLDPVLGMGTWTDEDFHETFEEVIG